MNDQLQSALRSILKAAGGALVAKGLMSGSDADILVSAVLILAGLIWSAVHHAKNPSTPSTPGGPTVTRLVIVASLGGLAAVLVGCGTFGTNPSPPSAFEQKLFDTATNYHAVVVTNTVYATNVVPVTVSQSVTNWTTNNVGVVQVYTNVFTVTEYQTNVVPVAQAVVTNQVASYTETPKAGVAQGVSTGATLLNALVPGAGGLVSSGILGLLTLWGYLRSSKLGDTSTALAQEVETVREFVKALPNGASYDAALTGFLQQHQAEAGVLTQVLQVLEAEVSNPDAKAAAQQVINTVNALKATTTPVANVTAG